MSTGVETMSAVRAGEVPEQSEHTGQRVVVDDDMPVLETAVTVNVNDVPTALSRFGGGESVLFRFGGDTANSYVDLNIPYSLLDRFAELIAQSQAIYAMDEPPDSDWVMAT